MQAPLCFRIELSRALRCCSYQSKCVRFEEQGHLTLCLGLERKIENLAFEVDLFLRPPVNIYKSWIPAAAFVSLEEAPASQNCHMGKFEVRANPPVTTGTYWDPDLRSTVSAPPPSPTHQLYKVDHLLSSTSTTASSLLPEATSSLFFGHPLGRLTGSNRKRWSQSLTPSLFSHSFQSFLQVHIVSTVRTHMVSAGFSPFDTELRLQFCQQDGRIPTATAIPAAPAFFPPGYPQLPQTPRTPASLNVTPKDTPMQASSTASSVGAETP